MYFKEIKTLVELKKKYKKLVKLHHPDNGGKLETIQAINNEFDILSKKLKNEKDISTEQDFNIFKDIIYIIINLEDIEIEICGTWLWVSGNTKFHRKILKMAGLKYASKKKMWYYRPEKYKSNNKKTMSMSHIRSKYGSDVIRKDKKQNKKIEVS